LARPIVSIPHLFQSASAINFRKDYSPPLVCHLDPTPIILLRDVSQLEAHFGPFRDSVNLDAK
jgi:hypothetical protein